MFQREHYYVEGESAGYLLARLARVNTTTNVIFAIRTDRGRITSHVPEIVDISKKYYEKLYSAQGGEGEAEMLEFFRDLKNPHLMEEDREALDAPIVLEEVRQAVLALAN